MKFKRLFTKKKHYDYIISLGYNCEVAYKFLRYFKFEVSNLFNWANSLTIENLTNALKNFEEIACGEWATPNPLWKCENCNIYFHGKVSAEKYINKTNTPEETEADKLELISRIKYLKAKFKNIAQSQKKKLYIYKIKSQHIDSPPLLYRLKNIGFIQRFKILGSH